MGPARRSSSAARAGEPLEVADLGAQPDRGQRVHAAQAPQPADLLGSTASSGSSATISRSRLLAAMTERLDRALRVEQRRLCRRPSQRPWSTATHGVARSTPSRHRTGSPWRSNSFESRCRARIRSSRTASRARTRSRNASSSGPGHPDRVQLPGQKQPGEHAPRHARSVFTLSPRRARDLRRRRHHTLHPAFRELARQPVPGRAGLIRDPHRSRQPGAEPGRRQRLAASSKRTSARPFSASNTAATIFAACTSRPTRVLAFAMAGSSYSAASSHHWAC